MQFGIKSLIILLKPFLYFLPSEDTKASSFSGGFLHETLVMSYIALSSTRSLVSELHPSLKFKYLYFTSRLILIQNGPGKHYKKSIN